ncbi:MAG: hypothetical protein QOJ76_181 [Acidobacteriota bacterium]|jgi:hypothetical protein|nr:hypothetical protein [Acidobacteriota bacterium]
MMELNVAISWGFTQWILAVAVIIPVYAVIHKVLYSRKRNMPPESIKLLKWLIRVLVTMLIAACFKLSGLDSLIAFLK